MRNMLPWTSEGRQVILKLLYIHTYVFMVHTGQNKNTIKQYVKNTQSRNWARKQTTKRTQHKNWPTYRPSFENSAR